MVPFDRKKMLKALKAWWIELRTSGAYVLTFHSSVHSWRAFKKHFLNNALFVSLDRGKIVMAFWVHPWLDGAEIGYWMTESRRLDRKLWHDAIDFLGHLVKRFPVVVACTVQKRVVHLLKHLGFRMVGAVPNSWDGLDAWVLQVTEAEFNVRK